MLHMAHFLCCYAFGFVYNGLCIVQYMYSNDVNCMLFTIAVMVVVGGRSEGRVKYWLHVNTSGG